MASCETGFRPVCTPVYAAAVDRAGGAQSLAARVAGLSRTRRMIDGRRGAGGYEKGAPEGPLAKPAAETGALTERLADGLVDAVGLEGLDDEVAGAELDRLEDLGLLAEGGAHDHAGGGVDRNDLLEGGEAVLLGHRDVERRHLGAQLLEAGDGFDAVAGLPDDLVAALSERVAHHLPHERGVVDYEDTGHLRPPDQVRFQGWKGQARSRCGRPTRCRRRPA